MNNCLLHFGDCIEIMASMPEESVDGVITDPPYMIGAKSSHKEKTKTGNWADLENSAYWYSIWIKEARRVLKPTGWLAMCGNWRSLPTYLKALSLIHAPAESCMIWDKQWIGCGGKSQLRPRYELVLLSSMPKAIIKDRSTPDVYVCKWQVGNMSKTDHPAEKPVELYKHLITTLCPEGGVICDPFAGSCTAGVAVKDFNIEHPDKYTFIGIEWDAKHYEIGKKRLCL